MLAIVTLVLLPIGLSLLIEYDVNRFLQKKFNQFLRDVLFELAQHNPTLMDYYNRSSLTTLELCMCIRSHIHEIPKHKLYELSKKYQINHSFLLMIYTTCRPIIDPNHNIIPNELLEGDYVAYLFRLLRELDNHNNT